MRVLFSIPIVGRSFFVRPTLLRLALTRSASRLSSIHDGLRRSERARPQGRRPPVLNTGAKLEIRQPPTLQPYLSPAERRRARVVARQNPLNYKIKKGKKDITEPLGPGRTKTAGRRYGDPRDPLGKHSLLKKFKTGQLAAELREADEPEHIQHDDFARQFMAAEIDSLADSRMFPRPAGSSRSKSHYEKRREDVAPSRETRLSSFDRAARSERTTGGFYEEDSFGSNSTDWHRDAREPNSFGRDRRQMDMRREDANFTRDRQYREESSASFGDLGLELARGALRLGGGQGKGVSLGGNSSERPKQESWDWDTPLEAGRLDRSDSRKPASEVSYDGNLRERSDPHQRDRVSLHGEGRFDRLDSGGPVRQVTHGGGGGYDRPERHQRDSASPRTPVRDQISEKSSGLDWEPSSKVTETASAESWGENQGDRASARDEKPVKKAYVLPLSLPYTTAASQFLYGTSTVEAALSTSRRKLYKLYIYQGENRSLQEKDDYLAKLASAKGVPVEWVPEQQLPMLNKMSLSRPHNGHVLEASPLPQLPVKALGAVSGEKSRPGFMVELGYQSAEDVDINGTSELIITEPSSHQPFVLLLDEILDPQNLGGIIRTASFMGVSAVVTSKRGSAPVTPVALKASSGAAETMTLLSVESPLDFLTQSKSNGWRIYAAVPPKMDASRRLVDMHHVEATDPLLEDPCILVMGSEGEGLSRQLRRAAHSEITIPNMSGSRVVDSLNVGVATGLLCSAFVRGRSNMLKTGAGDAGALF